MKIPTELLYTKTHEWVKELENGNVQIGLTDFAQHALGDIVFVNLPEAGDGISAGDSFADVESVKAVSDIFSPVTGVVNTVNETLLDAPQSINETPYETWLVEAGDITEKEELLSPEEYEHFLQKGE